MSASSLASSPQGLIGDSNLTCMKPNFWLLFLNLFPSCPHLSVIQLYSISYLCQKPSSHSWLLFSLIPHLGPSHNPMPLDYCLLASTLVPLWSVLHSIQNTIHTIDRIIFWNHKSDYFISLLNTSVVQSKVLITVFKSLYNLTDHYLFNLIFYLTFLLGTSPHAGHVRNFSNNPSPFMLQDLYL